jgi:membrane-anchored protein YejM (alkaline phosphatase superfamily)
MTESHPKFHIQNILNAYFALLYASAFAMMSMFWNFVSPDSLGLKLYIGATTAGYAALYVLLPMTLTTLLMWLVRPGPTAAGWRRSLVYASAYLGGTLVLISLYADYRLYELYEYHFNGFVWNLITTPGGVTALGATDSTILAITTQVALFFIGTAAVLWLLHRHLHTGRLVSRRVMLAAAASLLLVLASEEAVYAYSTHTGQEDFLQAAEVVPFHLHTSATTVFKRLGVKRSALTNLRIAGGEVNYPSKDLQSVLLKNPPNIIMLVGESFRWDLLDPEITPNLWKLSTESQRFEQHYSGGNRTRMGLFSMFYGIYAPYWYSFERQRIPPALMEFIRGRNYQLALHTSQSFDYPELRHTLFAGISEQYMQELKTGEPWQRDRQNISDIITKLEKRDRQRPIYSFMFFESTHAPYTFPEESVIRPDYQKDLNYINMNLKDNVGQIHARYINAAHHIDREVGRLLEYLQESDMRDDTIILFTGDHGEEFMEKGHWGHGHSRSFPEEQIRVPLILHVPGQKAEVVSHRTSHLQIAPTLLKELGVRQDSLTYSSSPPLSSASPYFVAGEYNYMSIIDGHYKITFPFTGSDFFRYTVHDENDHPVSREISKQVVEQNQTRIDEVLKESTRFVRPGRNDRS